MTCRDRSEAYASVLRYTSSFQTDGVPLIPTSELHERLKQKEPVILVDVRTPEEQAVSMIPGAVTREIFESEILPSLPRDEALASETSTGEDLRSASGGAPLVVPYCTVGYRSGVYCRELMRTHNLRNVKNGEGVIMWTFDVGPLARPLSGAEAGRTPSFEQAFSPEARDDLVQPIGASEIDCKTSTSESPLVRKVHVYGKSWDMAADGFSTVYFSNAGGAWRFLVGKCKGSCSSAGWLWFGTLMLWYLLMTPMCGVMFKCGCVLAATKRGQVSPCNIFRNVALKLQCPWCTCEGFPCIFVGSDTKAFRDVPLLDTLPDGCLLTVFVVVVLHLSWSRLDRTRFAKDGHTSSVFIAKAMVTVSWFFIYTVSVGALFFLGSSDYPVFFSELRSQS